MTNPLGQLDDLPRVPLAHLPTPLEAMPNLSSLLAGGQLYVKRDDCTGLAFGGNKIRQLEFYFGEAVAQKADCILITGAVQSNFVRSAAAAAAKLGMEAHVQLEERVAETGPVYRTSGNVLLDKLLGATIYSYPDGEDETGADRRLGEIADQLRLKGKRPYIIPLGADHPPLGALGYVVAARELRNQLQANHLAFDEILVASGSGNTHAGLLFGLRALGCDIPLRGVCVRRGADLQSQRIAARCNAIADLLRMTPVTTAADVICDDRFLAPGYGRLNEAVSQAIKQAARYEALFVDPVYTGRVMASAIDRASATTADKSLLVIHSGGQPGLFAYEPELSAFV